MVGLFWHLFCQLDFVSGLSRQIAASFDDASTWLQLVLRCFASAPAKQSWRGDEQNEDEITVQTVRRGIRCQQLNNKQQVFWTMKCNHYKLLVIHCDNPCLSTHDSLHLSILQPLGWRMPSLVIFCRFIEHWITQMHHHPTYWRWDRSISPLANFLLSPCGRGITAVECML